MISSQNRNLRTQLSLSSSNNGNVSTRFEYNKVTHRAVREVKERLFAVLKACLHRAIAIVLSGHDELIVEVRIPVGNTVHGTERHSMSIDGRWAVRMADIHGRRRMVQFG